MCVNREGEKERGLQLSIWEWSVSMYFGGAIHRVGNFLVKVFPMDFHFLFPCSFFAYLSSLSIISFSHHHVLSTFYYLSFFSSPMTYELGLSCICFYLFIISSLLFASGMKKNHYRCFLVVSFWFNLSLHSSIHGPIIHIFVKIYIFIHFIYFT